LSFTYTYSKLKNSELCPRKYYEVDVAKHFKDSGEQLAYGIKVHDALKDAIKKGKPLPTDFIDYKPWVDWAREMPGEHLVENKWALSRQFAPTEYFGPRVWLRLHGDFIALNDRVAFLVDWKTGKKVNDPVQLQLAALCLFAHHPEVEVVQSMFVWLKDCVGDMRSDYKRLSAVKITRLEIPVLWEKLLPRIAVLEARHKNMDFPPSPSPTCRWCPVQSCEFNANDR
jgi:hypothetical protein